MARLLEINREVFMRPERGVVAAQPSPEQNPAVLLNTQAMYLQAGGPLAAVILTLETRIGEEGPAHAIQRLHGKAADHIAASFVGQDFERDEAPELCITHDERGATVRMIAKWRPALPKSVSVEVPYKREVHVDWSQEAVAKWSARMKEIAAKSVLFKPQTISRSVGVRNRRVVEEEIVSCTVCQHSKHQPWEIPAYTMPCEKHRAELAALDPQTGAPKLDRIPDAPSDKPLYPVGTYIPISDLLEAMGGEFLPSSHPTSAAVDDELRLVAALKLADARLELWKAARSVIARKHKHPTCPACGENLRLMAVRDNALFVECLKRLDDTDRPEYAAVLHVDLPEKLRGVEAHVFDIPEQHGGSKRT